MQISDHSLRQLDDAYLERLEEKALRSLSGRLLADLKAARERLNQNSQNSSRPPSSQAPWERPAPPAPSAAAEAEEEDPNETTPGWDPDAAAQRSLPEAGVESKGRAGKRKGAVGVGRAAPDRVDRRESHEPETCAGCRECLGEVTGSVYTGYYEVDWVRVEGGWHVCWTQHQWYEKACRCGHVTRAVPWRERVEGTDLGGFRLIGPGLASLIVALALRYRLSRPRIRAFLGEWLGVRLSVGAIHTVIDEVGELMAPVEAELIEAVQESGLLHADETPWPEQGAPALSLWLWVFTTAQVTLYYISHRGQELVQTLLENFAGRLMSDGWQAYRWLARRLRCWAHLKRKAVGLVESYHREAQAFGGDVLDLWKGLYEAVQKAREGPPQSLREDFEDRLHTFRARCEALRASSHSKTRDLAGEFLNDWEAIFAVLDHPHWPLTNNEAERALRHWVILRKLTHGTRTEQGSRRLALLASVIDTCYQRGHSPWGYLHTAVTVRRQGLPLPPLPSAVGG